MRVLVGHIILQKVDSVPNLYYVIVGSSAQVVSVSYQGQGRDGNNFMYDNIHLISVSEMWCIIRFYL